MDYRREYFTIEALESGLIIINSNTNNIWYRKSGSNWIQSVIENSATFQHTIEVEAGEKIQFKAIMPDTSIQDGTNIELDFVKFTFKNTTIKFNILGNIASLFFDSSNVDIDTQILNSEFIDEKKNSSLVGGYGMFANTYVQNAHNFIIESYQYVGCQKMFANCTELTAGPDITINTYNGFQYTNMFIGCNSLATDDQLNITRYDDIIALLAADIAARMNNIEENFTYYSTTTNERLNQSYNISTNLTNNLNTYISSFTSLINSYSSYSYTYIRQLSNNMSTLESYVNTQYAYLTNKINTNEIESNNGYTYLLSKLTSLENNINFNGDDITVAEYDDSELRNLILQTQSNINSSYVKAITRIESLELKPDQDTIYDDTEIKERLTYIDEHWTANRLYDASQLNNSINNVSSQLNSTTTYLNATYAYTSERLNSTYTYLLDSYAYMLQNIENIKSTYITKDDLEAASYITLTDIPDVDLTSFASIEYVNNKTAGLQNYDDTVVLTRITTLENTTTININDIEQINAYVINSYSYLVSKINELTQMINNIQS